ncbi:MAG: hypothetical protein JO332_02480 [Planctomycetaceae bacterium]|nr:hypothetical protein [Planctomycetaceae bacterium]
MPTLHWWGREKFRDLRKWAKDKMEARFSDVFYHMAILHAGVLPPPLLKREVDFKITEELRRPPDHPKDHHKKDDKKHAAAAHGHDKGAHEAHGKGKAAGKPAPKSKPAPKKAVKPKAKSKPAAKKKR